MSFADDIERVKRAEQALETNTRAITREWLRLRQTWGDAWTPGRIVIAGLAGGFLIGRSEPSNTTASGFINLVSALSGLFAVDQAGVAVEAVDDVADTAGEAVVEIAQHATDDGSGDGVAVNDDDVLRTHEALRRSGAW
ncbi:hypothetical protein [Solilutibacter silvestris]|uniref:Uncharacterized protein n=1 Tax=Solilutibacter silvestris TaxID=1645665 RepID=A0A2K1Q250_9GAMM|nr:hypothetical protein [Lysobacter silvestris]PNS09125.1 hypothetical protein Lysil_0754 [Lysobacter silvestris]